MLHLALKYYHVMWINVWMIYNILTLKIDNCLIIYMKWWIGQQHKKQQNVYYWPKTQVHNQIYFKLKTTKNVYNWSKTLNSYMITFLANMMIARDPFFIHSYFLLGLFHQLSDVFFFFFLMPYICISIVRALGVTLAYFSPIPSTLSNEHVLEIYHYYPNWSCIPR